MNRRRREDERPIQPPAQAGEDAARRKPGGPSRSERQRRQVRRSKGRRITRRIAFLTLTLGMAFLAVTVFFRVERLEITGTAHYSAEEIERTLGVTQGDNLFAFRTGALQKRLLAEYPYLSRVEIRRQLPDGLTVRAVDAVPVLAIDAAGGGSFLADAAGRLLEQVHTVPAGPAPVTGVLLEEAKPGDRLQKEDKSGILLRLTAALQQADMLEDVDFINVSAAYDVRFGYLGRLDVRLGEAASLAEKLYMLQRIVDEELSPSDVCIIHLSDPTTAYCPPTTREQIEQSMLPLEDAAETGPATVQEE